MSKYDTLDGGRSAIIDRAAEYLLPHLHFPGFLQVEVALSSTTYACIERICTRECGGAQRNGGV